MTQEFILVTGTPRSGTTAVGSLLSLSARTFYLYEPTNFHAGDRAVTDYFMVPGSPRFSAADAKALYDRIFQLDLDLKQGVWDHEKGFKRALKRVTGGRTKNSYRICRYNKFLKNIIWKDPFMMFSIGYMLDHYSMPIVVTQRRVEGVAASFKRFGWGFDIPRLLSDLPYGLDIAEEAANFDFSDPVVNAAALYSLAKLELDRLAQNPRVLVVDLDDLIDRPVEMVASIYDHCGLAFTDLIQAKVEGIYSRKGKTQYSNSKAHVKNRDLSQIKTYWSKFLTREDQQHIHDIMSCFGCA